MTERAEDFYRVLGLPSLRVHPGRDHFDFSTPGRIILLVGPMGSGKTGFAAQIWRDARVAKTKVDPDGRWKSPAGADLRKVFFVRSRLDRSRFADYPEDALAYRGGYEQLGGSIADIGSSFDLETLVDQHPDTGTWIVDEASFYDERMAYAIQRLARSRGLVFVLPTLILNFRKAPFNATAGLLLEVATDVVPLTAYCEHETCLTNSTYTYRYYTVNGEECPALFFDPLIIVGGDVARASGRDPDYATRCTEHHVLPGKDYTFLVLKPLGERAAVGDVSGLEAELYALHNDPLRSQLGQWLTREHAGDTPTDRLSRNALAVPYLAERALCYVFAEQNLIGAQTVRDLTHKLDLDRSYLEERLSDNRRPVDFG